MTSYGYDLAGNRITKSTDGRTEKYFYNNRNQLTELHREKDVVRYSYDPAGNLTEENYLTADGASTQKLRYTYDVYNRNVSVTGDDFTQKNHYDAEGLRYAVTENGETTNFVYRNGMPVSELDADKNPVRGYILGNEYISQVDGTSFGYYLNDEQGSVRYLTGSDGSIRNHYRYSAFGETITAEETVQNRLRYNGQMADGLTGLYYLRARYYNASLGRFTQEDVIYNDGLNLYAYCNSNPVMYSDPSGFAAKSTQPTQESMCKRKNGGEKDSKSGKNSNYMFGENGTQFESKTTWKNGKTERIDIENPAPGERPGQIHYHEPNNTKWYLDVNEMKFYNQKTGEMAPKSIQKILKNKDVINAINKGLKFLGE